MRGPQLVPRRVQRRAQLGRLGGGRLRRRARSLRVACTLRRRLRSGGRQQRLGLGQAVPQLLQLLPPRRPRSLRLGAAARSASAAAAGGVAGGVAAPAAAPAAGGGVPARCSSSIRLSRAFSRRSSSTAKVCSSSRLFSAIAAGSLGGARACALQGSSGARPATVGDAARRTCSQRCDCWRPPGGRASGGGAEARAAAPPPTGPLPSEPRRAALAGAAAARSAWKASAEGKPGRPARTSLEALATEPLEAVCLGESAMFRPRCALGALRRVSDSDSGPVMKRI